MTGSYTVTTYKYVCMYGAVTEQTGGVIMGSLAGGYSASEEPAAYMCRFTMPGYLAGGKIVGLVAVNTVMLQLDQQT
jgi:hypothetical protein